jgi:hypothetical protein
MPVAEVTLQKKSKVTGKPLKRRCQALTVAPHSRRSQSNLLASGCQISGIEESHS